MEKNFGVLEMLWAERHSTPSVIESDELFITKSFDVANYLNDYFLGKVDKFKQEHANTEQ
jgi:hypothetical protein